MDYELSSGALFLGLLIIAVGVVFVRFYQWVADNFGSGVSSYERYKLYAILTCVFGLLMMINVPGYLLGLVAQAIFPQL